MDDKGKNDQSPSADDLIWAALMRVMPRCALGRLNNNEIWAVVRELRAEGFDIVKQMPAVEVGRAS